MCQAVQEMCDDARAEGRQAGSAEGRTAGLAEGRTAGLAEGRRRPHRRPSGTSYADSTAYASGSKILP